MRAEEQTVTRTSATIVDDAAARAVAPLAESDFDAGVLPRLRQVVQAQPDAIAVADSHRALSYAELAAEAARVRRVVLRSSGGDDPVRVDPLPEGSAVAMLFPHCAGAVAALAGLLSSGHPVVVLDARTPAPRLAVFVERAGVAGLLVHPQTRQTGEQVVAAAPGLRLLPVDEVPEPAPADELWSDVPEPTSAAALSFTSGSTGLPKVVVSDHRMLVRDAWTNSIDTGCYDADDVVAHTLPMAFNAGFMVTVAGMMVGSRMELFDVRSSGIAGMPAWLDQVGATVMHASPAILRAFVATEPRPALLARLRSLTVAGEAAHGKDVEAARALLPAGCVVRNRYGSSETGLIAEYPVPGDHPPLSGALPAGRPVTGDTLQVIGEDGAPLPAGTPGVLTVTSRYISTGYLDPEATAAAFTVNADGSRTYRSSDVGVIDEHGVLRLLGRRDHSVKIRGYLVEPGEVDEVLFRLPDVREAVTVAAGRTDSETKRLVSYVVSTASQTSAAAVRAELRGQLPSHMVPEVVIFLEALPRTERGKLDRSQLPEPPVIGGPETYGPMSDWEQAIAAVWADALELESVGPDTDFFELGGDSLAAEAVLAQTVAVLGVPAEQVTMTALVEAPTVREFATRVRRTPDALGAVLIPLNPVSEKTSDKPPVFFVAGGGGLGVAFVALARRLGDRASYALQLHAMERRGLPDWTVKRTARRNIAAMKTVAPQGPYVIAGHSYGGIVAYEMAQQLRAAGELVELLAILDSFPPNPVLHPVPETRPLLARVKSGVGLLATGWATTPGTGNYWRFYDMTSFIGRHHRGRPYPGRALVLIADSPEREQRSAWTGYLTGDWQLREVPGDHYSMLREPQVAGLAQELLGALGD